MFTAPAVALQGHTVPTPQGVGGIMDTLRRMRQYVRQYRTDPAIVGAARSIVFSVPQKDDQSEMIAIFEWVRDMVRYVRDVLEVETLSTPDKTLATRSGDCDDQVTLLAALLESVGYATRFVVTGYTMPGVYEHVHLQVRDPARGVWIDADPTEPESFGWAPEGAVSSLIEKV